MNLEWLIFEPLGGYYNEIFVLLWNYEFFSFGVDGISFPFIYLTCFLVPLCILYNWHTSKSIRPEYLMLLVFVEMSLILFFMTANVLLFFFLFECLLFPFFIMFGIRSLRKRKTHASLLLLAYTLIGSFSLVAGILSLYSKLGTFDLFLLSCFENNLRAERTLCSLFLFSFITKIPMIPFHSWLPEAHVEAPTEISVVLAGVILKIGTYGMLRVLLPVFEVPLLYFTPILLVLGALSICYASLAAMTQLDIKKIIAYSSIAHMNVAVIGICCATIIPLCGSIFVMFSHGIVSGGLFFLIGMLYERYGTKIIRYYTGLSSVMPLYSVLFFLFVLGNIGFPITSGFIGEVFILIGATESGSMLFILFVAFGIFIGSVYTLWLYNKLFFGMPSTSFCGDLTYREFMIVLPLTIHLVCIGIFPNVLFEQVYLSVQCYYTV